mmetsp:Transcript_19394/g.21691  ORF Transcript_19394/g.21691 Transcript_19394/m.21691 type:complete len:274 (+) Transcript_19394:607-1428(+)
MMKIYKFHLLLLKRQIIIFNREYNTWKEKLIEKKRKEESKFTKLDENTDGLNPELLQDIETPSEESSTPKAAPPPNLPGISGSNEGSNSFAGGYSNNFYMPSAPNKNTTFELPKTSSPGFNQFSLLDGSKGGGMNPHSTLNTTAPGYNTMIPLNGGNAYPQYMEPPQFGAKSFSNQSPHGGMLLATQCYGRLKFFDEVQNYGFLVVDGDESDLFVHYDDLRTSKLSRDILRQAKTNYFLQFSFDIVKYTGKYKESRKAVNLKLMKIEKLGIVN